MVGRNPVQGSLHLAVGTFHSALADRIVFCLNLDDVSFCILGASGTLHNIGIFQTNLLAGSHAEELLWSIFHEVATLYPQILAEGNGVCTVSLVLRIVDSFHFLALSLRIVGDNEFHRVEYCTYSACFLVEILTYRSLEKSHVVEGVELGIANAVDKHANALW